MKALRVSIEQAGKEQVLLDEHYDPPRPEVHFRWMASQDKAFRLAEGPAQEIAAAKREHHARDRHGGRRSADF